MKFTRPRDGWRERKVRPTVHERFAEAVLGGQPYLVPGEAGLRDLAVCLAMAESSRTGRAIDLEDFIGEIP
jgi:predicted dehydrogenase